MKKNCFATFLPEILQANPVFSPTLVKWYTRISATERKISGLLQLEFKTIFVGKVRDSYWRFLADKCRTHRFYMTVFYPATVHISTCMYSANSDLFVTCYRTIINATCVSNYYYCCCFWNFCSVLADILALKIPSKSIILICGDAIITRPQTTWMV